MFDLAPSKSFKPRFVTLLIFTDKCSEVEVQSALRHQPTTTYRQFDITRIRGSLKQMRKDNLSVGCIVLFYYGRDLDEERGRESEVSTNSNNHRSVREQSRWPTSRD
jgi:hypothetical protein